MKIRSIPSYLSDGTVSVVVEWNPNPPEEEISYYIVRYGTDPLALSFRADSNGPEPSLTIDGLAPSTIYYFQLFAVNKVEAVSTASETVQFNTSITTAPDSMNLYYINSPNVNAWTSAVVAAPDESTATLIHPTENGDIQFNQLTQQWVYDGGTPVGPEAGWPLPEHVSITYLGTAEAGVTEGVVSNNYITPPPPPVIVEDMKLWHNKSGNTVGFTDSVVAANNETSARETHPMSDLVRWDGATWVYRDTGSPFIGDAWTTPSALTVVPLGKAANTQAAGTIVYHHNDPNTTQNPDYSNPTNYQTNPDVSQW